jgi:hypothetical protein
VLTPRLSFFFFFFFQLPCCIGLVSVLRQKLGVCLMFRITHVMTYHLVSFLFFLLNIHYFFFSFFIMHLSTNVTRRMLHIWWILPVMSLQASNANVVQVVTYVGLYQIVLKIRYEPHPV